jgi:hypothetical protein
MLNEDACELVARGLHEIGQGEIREIRGRHGDVEIGIDRRTLLRRGEPCASKTPVSFHTCHLTSTLTLEE